LFSVRIPNSGPVNVYIVLRWKFQLNAMVVINKRFTIAGIPNHIGLKIPVGQTLNMDLLRITM